MLNRISNEEPISSSDNPSLTEPRPALPERLKRFFFGNPRDLNDKSIFHRISLIPFLAWVGLGADGLSSSAYGPEEAFRTLGEHTYLATALATLMAVTVFIISSAYSRIIEEFPRGGGGYVVATKLLGKRAGLISGCALLVDYVLTITVSIAASGDALFSFLPISLHPMKLPMEVVLIVALIILNVRGVRESTLALAPVFLIFLVTHALLIGGGIAAHATELPATARSVSSGFQSGLSALGLGGMLLLFVHAYSLGGGTYTGIEAVSNGLPIMREPRVQTAKRTMLYMAVSLAFTAAGLLVSYLLWHISPEPGKTMNAVLVETLTRNLPFRDMAVILTLVSEGALLVVAAQAGFIDGPRVLANMALDNWVPRRFAALSDRLTTHNGIFLMGGAGLLTLYFTKGDVHQLVVMYSINVFLTFSLSMLAMIRAGVTGLSPNARSKKRLALFGVGFLLCATILCITVLEKFHEGGWITLLVTGSLLVLCLVIRRHYQMVGSKLSQLYSELRDVPSLAAKKAQAPHPRPKEGLASEDVTVTCCFKPGVPRDGQSADSHDIGDEARCDLAIGDPDPEQPAAAVLVAGYGGLGIHTVLNIFRSFPNHFKSLVFLSVGVVDSGEFKGGENLVEVLRAKTEEMLQKYIALAHSLGIPATYKLAIGTDAVAEAEGLCLEISMAFPKVTFFAGKIIFEREKWYHRLLHNETAFAIQKRLQWRGKPMVIIPAKAI